MNHIKETINNMIEQKEYGKVVELLKDFIRESPSLSNYIYAEKIYDKITPYLDGIKIKIAILRSITIEPIVQYLTVKCFENGIIPEIYLGDYNIFEMEILDSKSSLYNFSPDILILFTRIEEIAPKLLDDYIGLDSSIVKSLINDILGKIENLVSVFRNFSKAKVIVHNFELPPNPAYGIVDLIQDGSQTINLIELNLLLANLIKKYDEAFVLDYERLISCIGKQNWFDEKLWYTSRMPVSRIGLESLADEYVKFIKPSVGMTKKCLVFDLDNTLWGGVLGEEGVDGIKIDSNYPGLAFLEFQKEILKLYKKGFILAINSKNNESNVMEVFEKNTNMLLKLNYFAALRINWNDKAQNMREIAEDLNIGLDSLVFFDDNPVERELIKQALPQVQVVEMPENPIYYKKILTQLDCFQRLNYSDEDMKRGEIYSQQIQRKKDQSSHSNIEDFYRSLEMVAIIKENDINSIARLAQMTQKTNQFNLTTKRYAETDIENYIKGEKSRIYSLKLLDKFGDNGIVGEIIIVEENHQWIIDTFLLSCRVIGRTVETAFLSYILKESIKHNISAVYGEYLPTNKNDPVRFMYENNGFDIVEDHDGHKKYKIDTKSIINCPEWVRIENE